MVVVPCRLQASVTTLSVAVKAVSRQPAGPAWFLPASRAARPDHDHRTAIAGLQHLEHPSPLLPWLADWPDPGWLTIRPATSPLFTRSLPRLSSSRRASSILHTYSGLRSTVGTKCAAFRSRPRQRRPADARAALPTLVSRFTRDCASRGPRRRLPSDSGGHCAARPCYPLGLHRRSNSPVDASRYDALEAGLPSSPRAPPEVSTCRVYADTTRFARLPRRQPEASGPRRIAGREPRGCLGRSASPLSRSMALETKRSRAALSHRTKDRCVVFDIVPDTIDRD